MLQSPRVKFYPLPHDKRTRARKLVRVESLNHRRRRNTPVPRQHTPDFNRRNPLPTRLETVIAASQMKPKPIFIAAIKITRPYPTIDKRARCRLGILPVTTRRTVTTNPQVSLINQPRLVTFEQSPAAAVAHFVPM